MSTNPFNDAEIDPQVGYAFSFNKCPELVCHIAAAKLNSVRFVTAQYSDGNIYLVYDNGSSD